MKLHPFPYPLGNGRELVGKPKNYKGWTIWLYRLRCQQTGSKQFVWQEMALATRGVEGETLLGAVYQKIDALENMT